MTDCKIAGDFQHKLEQGPVKRLYNLSNYTDRQTVQMAIED